MHEALEPHRQIMVQNPIRATQFSASGTLCPEGSLYDQLGFVTQGKAQRWNKMWQISDRTFRQVSLVIWSLKKKKQKTKKRLYSVNAVDEPFGIGGAVEG